MGSKKNRSPPSVAPKLKPAAAAPAAESSVPPAKCNVTRCMVILAIGNLLTPLDTQAPTPLLPLLLTVELQQPVVAVGRIFTALTAGSFISFGLLLPLARCMSARGILLLDFGARFLSGGLYLWALRVPGGTPETLYTLYAARTLYGLTLNSFSLPAAWIGVRLPKEQRPQRVIMMQAALAFGIVFGPVLGSVLASSMPDTWAGYQSTGYFTLGNSGLLFLLVLCFFDDVERMPADSVFSEGKDLTEAEREEERKVSFIIRAAALSAFFITMGLMAGFETLMGLAVYHSFGWDTHESLRAWVPFGAMSLVTFMLAPMLLHRVPKPYLALGCLLGSGGAGLLVHWSDLHQVRWLPLIATDRH